MRTRSTTFMSMAVALGAAFLFGCQNPGPAELDLAEYTPGDAPAFGKGGGKGGGGGADCGLSPSVAWFVDLVDPGGLGFSSPMITSIVSGYADAKAPLATAGWQNEHINTLTVGSVTFDGNFTLEATSDGCDVLSVQLVTRAGNQRYLSDPVSVNPPVEALEAGFTLPLRTDGVAIYPVDKKRRPSGPSPGTLSFGDVIYTPRP